MSTSNTRHLALIPDAAELAVLNASANRLRFRQLNRRREQLAPVGRGG